MENLQCGQTWKSTECAFINVSDPVENRLNSYICLHSYSVYQVSKKKSAPACALYLQESVKKNEAWASWRSRVLANL